MTSLRSRIDTWLAAAIADADRRGLPELKPLLEALARSTEALRGAEAELRGRREPVTTDEETGA